MLPAPAVATRVEDRVARFVLANRRGSGGDSRARGAEAAVQAFRGLFGAGNKLINARESSGERPRVRYFFEAEREEIAAKRQELPPSVLIEPERQFWASNSIEVRTVDGALLRAFVHVVRCRGHQVVADVITPTREEPYIVPAGWEVLEVIVQPCDAWAAGRKSLEACSIRAESLPSGPIGWWHRLVGMPQVDLRRGRGIRVGIIDSGVGPHPALAVQDAGAFVEGAYLPSAGADVSDHGTHVAGLIAARPTAASHFVGIAPAVELYSVRVFPSGGVPTNQVDVANALELLSENRGVNLVNLSVGGRDHSDLLLDAVLDAFDVGTLCIAAAGNSGAEIHYPARFQEVISVGAVGCADDGCLGPWARDSVVPPLDLREFWGALNDVRLFFAPFSSRGPNPTLNCVAPGVGLLSCVPDPGLAYGPYAEMSGTSMAAPVVTGVLAAALARREDYLSLAGTAEGATKARTVLHGICSRPEGLAEELVGWGLPVFPAS